MLSRPLLLLVDTTVLYSALAYRGLKNRVLRSGDNIFVTTEFMVAEIYRIITTKRGFSRSEAISLID